MQVRAPRDDDFSAIAEITNHYIATTAIHFAYEPVLASDLLAGWRQHARYPWRVAEDDAGRVVAYAKAGVYRERAAYAWTTETAGLRLWTAMACLEAVMGERSWTA